MSFVVNTVTVTTSGTRVQFGTATTGYKVIFVRARPANGSAVYVGGSTVTSTSGVMLYPGETFPFFAMEEQNIRISDFYLDSDINSDRVDFWAGN